MSTHASSFRVRRSRGWFYVVYLPIIIISTLPPSLPHHATVCLPPTQRLFVPQPVFSPSHFGLFSCCFQLESTLMHNNSLPPLGSVSLFYPSTTSFCLALKRIHSRCTQSQRYRVGFPSRISARGNLYSSCGLAPGKG